jgi:uncharacterized membrane protein YhaH (DUF805 family)
MASPTMPQPAAAQPGTPGPIGMPPTPNWGGPVAPNAYPSYGQGTPYTNPYGQTSYAAKPVEFGEAMRRGFTLWTTRGRASRSEYWWWVLGITLGYLPLGIVLGFMPDAVGVPVSALAQLFLFVATLKITIRRYHDIGKGGGWVAGIYIGSIVGALLFVFGAVAAFAGALAGDDNVAGGGMMFLLFGGLLMAGFGIWNLVMHCLAGKPERNRFDA